MAESQEYARSPEVGGNVKGNVRVGLGLSWREGRGSCQWRRGGVIAEKMALSRPLLSGRLIRLDRGSGFSSFWSGHSPDLGGKGPMGEQWTKHRLITSMVAGPTEQSLQ